MAISFHPQCRKRLIEIVARAVTHTQVLYGAYPDTRGVADLMEADSAVPTNGKLREDLTTYVGEQPIVDFVLNELTEEFGRRGNSDYQAVPAKLTDIEGFDDPTAVAERLIQKLETLPWDYKFTIKLPNAIAPLLQSDEEKRFGNQLRLVRPDNNFIQQFPLTDAVKVLPGSMAEALMGFFDHIAEPWSEGSLYLQIGSSGFAGSPGRGEANLLAPRMLKAFFGLGFALRLFEFERPYSPSLTRRHALIKHRKNADGLWENERSLELTDELSRALVGVKLHMLDGYLDTPEKQSNWISRKLEDMKTVFETGDEGDALRLASQWLFDSYIGTDDLQSYIQCMIVLEILLGDKKISDEIGLGQLLGNRCAYLIGNSYEERAGVLLAFKDIYQVRSDIVHSGKHRLSLRERFMSKQLLAMCRRVIEKEITLLKSELGVD